MFSVFIREDSTLITNLKPQTVCVSVCLKIAPSKLSTVVEVLVGYLYNKAGVGVGVYGASHRVRGLGADPGGTGTRAADAAP